MKALTNVRGPQRSRRDAWLAIGVVALKAAPAFAATSTPPAVIPPEFANLDDDDDESPSHKLRYTGLTQPPRAVTMALTGGPLWTKSSAKARAGVGDGGIGALSFRYSAFPFYGDVGLGAGVLTDRQTFSETACSAFDVSDCTTGNSEIEGLALLAESGVMVHFLLPLSKTAFVFELAAGVGYTGLFLWRSVPHGGNCGDCRSDFLDFNGGLYLSPELELAYALPKEPMGKTPELQNKLNALVFGLRAKPQYYVIGDVQSALWFGPFLDWWWDL